MIAALNGLPEFILVILERYLEPTDIFEFFESFDLLLDLDFICLSVPDFSSVDDLFDSSVRSLSSS